MCPNSIYPLIFIAPPAHAEFNHKVVPKVGNAQNKGQHNFRASECLSNPHTMHVFFVHPPPTPAFVLGNVYFKADAACVKLFS